MATKVELQRVLDEIGVAYTQAINASGAPDANKNAARKQGRASVNLTKLELQGAPNQVPVVNVDANKTRKGKNILDNLKLGLDRMLLSINICIVLLRAAGFDKTTVDSALAFVRKLKPLYDALCASVTPVNTNNAKVNAVKGALDVLLAQPIPADVMAALQAVVRPMRANDNEFNDYADEVKAKARALKVAVPANLAEAMVGVGNADLNRGNVGANAAAQQAAAAAAAAAVAAAAPPPNVPLPVRAAPPPPALAPLPAAPAGAAPAGAAPAGAAPAGAAPAGVADPPLPTDATPEDFGDTATGVKGNTAVFQGINIDASGYVRGAPGVMINKPVKIYAVSYVPVGGVRMYELIGDGKIFSQASGKGIAVAFNKNPKPLYVKFYTNPPLKTKGGRRRTKAKSKASRKTKRRSTRRNRRS